MVDPTAGRSIASGPAGLWLPVAAWAALIFYLSSTGEPPRPEPVAGLPVWPQAAHFGLYFVLGALLYRGFRGAGRGVRGAGCRVQDAARCGEGGGAPAAGGGRLMLWAFSLAVLAGALYAVSDEVHQSLVPRRQADIWDWLVDLAGLLAGALAALAATRRRDKV